MAATPLSPPGAARTPTSSVASVDGPYNPPPPKPKRQEMKTTLGQLINPEVLSDHFDHYGAPSLAKPSYDNNHNQTGKPTSGVHSYSARADERSLSPTEEVQSDDEFVEAPTDFAPTHQASPQNDTRLLNTKPKKLHKKPSTLSRDDTYLCSIENDVRKELGRSQEPSRTQDDIALTSKAKSVLSRQNNLSQAMSKQMGSLPDITSLQDLATMPKEDLMRLSAARREEIKKLLEEQERRNAGDITVLAGDVKVRVVNGS